MARFEYLNVNPEGQTTEDCVVRAITLATGMPYEIVEEKLWQTADLYGCDRLCRYCYSNYITSVLGYKEVNCDGLTIEEFADMHPYGTYIIRVPSHLTTIINGTIYDIWDCRDEMCDVVWKRVD